MARLVGMVWGLTSAPLRVPFKTAVRTVETLRDVVAVLLTDDGRLGWGSAPATAKVTGTTEGSLCGAYAELEPVFRGADPDDLMENLRILSRAIPGNESAKAALDCALHDLWSQGMGVPLWRALGGQGGAVETDLTISVNEPAQMARDAASAVERGFSVLKTKVGLDPVVDLDRLKAVRQAAGPKVKIRIDANQGWTVRQALVMLEEMERLDLGIELVEQPVPARDRAGLAEVARRSPVPVVADESCWSAADALELMEQSPLWPNIKLMKCGGLGEARKIVALAELFDREVMVGSMLEGKICCAAAVVLTLGRGVCTRIDLDGPALLADDPVFGGPVFDGPVIQAWNEPGLGMRGLKNFELWGGTPGLSFDPRSLLCQEGEEQK